MRHQHNFKKMRPDMEPDAPEPVNRRDNLPPEIESLPSYTDDVDLKNLEVHLAAACVTIEQQNGKVIEKITDAWAERRGVHFDATPVKGEADIGRFYTLDLATYADAKWRMNPDKVHGTGRYLAMQMERIFDEELGESIRKALPGLVLDAVFAQRARLIDANDPAFKRCLIVDRDGQNNLLRINPVMLEAHLKLSVELRKHSLETGEAAYGDVVIGMLLGRLEVDVDKRNKDKNR